MPTVAGQNNPCAGVFLSTVNIIWASGWLETGIDPIRPTRPAPAFGTATNPSSAPRRKANSALTSGRSLPPAPVPVGSPVWAMKPGMTR